MWPTRSVECGAGEHAEAELLVETARRLILFVYVDNERAPAKLILGLFAADGQGVRRLEATSFQIWNVSLEQIWAVGQVLRWWPKSVITLLGAEPRPARPF